MRWWDVRWCATGHFISDDHNLETCGSSDRWYHWDPALLPWHPLLVSPSRAAGKHPESSSFWCPFSSRCGLGKWQKDAKSETTALRVWCAAVWADYVAEFKFAESKRGDSQDFQLRFQFNGLVKCGSCSNHGGGNRIYPLRFSFLVMAKRQILLLFWISSEGNRRVHNAFVLMQGFVSSISRNQGQTCGPVVRLKSLNIIELPFWLNLGLVALVESLVFLGRTNLGASGGLRWTNDRGSKRMANGSHGGHSGCNVMFHHLRYDAILHQMRLISMLHDYDIDQYDIWCSIKWYWSIGCVPTFWPWGDENGCRSCEKEVALAEAGGWSWKDWWRTACMGKSDTWIFNDFTYVYILQSRIWHNHSIL